MRSSDIVDPRTDPMSLLVASAYVQRSAAALLAYASTGSVEQLARADTTVHEFIGDLSYLGYLGGA
jgi:hypothetical protein